MRKVLVVGGAGYIGGAVTDLLLARSIPFAVFDDLLYEPHYLKPVEFIRGDVRTVDSQVFRDYSHIIWLAAIVGDAAAALTPELTNEVNHLSVHRLANSFPGRIIFTSTCSVYGEHHGVVDERSATNPLSLYAKTKKEAENYLIGKDALILRLGTAFGISDTYSRPRMDLVANQMSVAALQRGVLTVNGGEQWRPLIHVRDVAKTIVNNLELKSTGIYNLATTNLQIKNLAQQIAAITKCEIEYAPMAEDGRDYRVTPGKAIQHEVMDISEWYDIPFCVEQFADLVNEGRVRDLDHNRYFNVRHLARRQKWKDPIAES
jgi:nucleoside-diphosphate-sugar epimerase